MVHVPTLQTRSLSVSYSYATYSRDATSSVAQQRSEEEMQMIVKLQPFHRLRLITSPIKTIDPQAQVISFDDRPAIL